MNINFCSLSSGSSGNCYYLGNEFHGILIDAGISARAIQKHLKTINVSIQSIMGILVSHNHSDHVRGLDVLTRRYNIPVFTTEKIWDSIMHPRRTIARDCIRNIPLRQSFHLAGFEIEAFPVSHDAPETVGFHILAGHKKITLATDMGFICPTSASYIKKADFLVIESNYDEDMLLNGSYPYYLKQRIRSEKGHLGNLQTAAFLAENMHEKISHICLAHLSKNNNTPERALHALHQSLSEKGITVNGHPVISVLKRDTPTEMICIKG